MKYFYATFLGLLMVVLGTDLSAQSYWSDSALPARSNQHINPASYRGLHLDIEALQATVETAPAANEVSPRFSNSVISIPMPDGTMESFRFSKNTVMAPSLQARYPFIQTFVGQGIENPTSILRFDITQKGFHGMILSSKGSIYIDPLSLDDTEYYMSYTKEAFYQNTEKVFEELPPIMPDHIDSDKYEENVGIKKTKKLKPNVKTMGVGNRTPNGAQLRTYDLALACTGEYAAFHGGTTAGALAAMVTSMNRVNGVYERDCAITMILVPNNDQIIFLNGATDPYTNGNGGAMLGQNQTTCDNIIGSANYDIGHVYSTGGGGVAFLQSPCGGNKAGGVTGQATPVGDPFDIDYVCHEMGHQYGGNHTQNNSCNRSAGAAFEPGSASTIMGYAGICAPNLQSNSDDHFHNHSYNEIYNFTVTGNGNTCATISNTGNTPPTVDAGNGGQNIPYSTPFELTAVGNDVDGDALTYNWEEYDLGPATAGGDTDLSNPSGTQPTFRSWPSETSPTRVFPRLSELVNNTTVIGEHLPDYARSMTFRCTVRDNRANGGGVNDDQMTFNITDQAGPFVVSSPNTAVSYPGNSLQVVSWDVANTDQAPVNCSSVDIYISTDGGFTYPTLLVGNTPNDGSQAVLLPSVLTSTARIKVKASNNIFFDISNANFSITAPVAGADNDVALTAINSPQGDYCGDTFVPEVVVSNLGGLELTSFDLTYDVDGASPQTLNWTGSLASGQSTTITLPSMMAASGAHTFNATVDNPNGVTDEGAINNSSSTNFSTVTGATVVTLSILTDCWGEEVSWSLDEQGGGNIGSSPVNTYADQTTYDTEFCLAQGCYDLTINDSFGDGLSGIASGCAIDGDYNVTDEFGNELVQMTVVNYGSQVIESFCVPVGTPGCTDDTACNYDPAATVDDGSCDFSCIGCTNPAACNFNPVATTDDGSCELPDGCTDASACNFDPTATCDDGSCILPDGCTNATACNYNPAAICDDGSCILPDGCTDNTACNYDPAAVCDDGSCESLSCAGCTNATACNFDPTATIDDGSCDLPDGCTDIAACNFDPTASCDDGSCVFATAYYVDGDNDGFGTGSAVMLCAPQTGFADNDLDCDDTLDTVFPNAPGTGEGIDNNCNMVIDPSEEIPACAGDFNLDGMVNIADLLLLLGEYGCLENCAADMNGDGVVNTSDSLLFFGVFGNTCPQ
ncbi:MAG: M12 family metallo-peptidase [Flavobacteriales bacterium]|nr:M12 family metallo-peptidase [Flavobacteriales bacterium]MDG2245242.1 M12 family metallo-peptidase [Flavobacteriales bacterium]